MDLQDLFTALDVRQADIDLTVEAAGAEQRLIEDVGTVGSRHDDDAVVGLKTVHLDQQLVQGLLTFIVAAAQAGAALAADRVDLVDEDDAGHGLLGLVEQVAYAGSADADVHLHEIRAGDGVERHTGLTGAGAGQQGLAGTRRAHEQDAVGDAGTEGVELVRALEELDDFLQFFLLLVLTGHIGEGRGLLVLMLILDLGFADVHDAAATGTAPHHGEEQEAGAAQHPQIEQDLHPWDGLLEGGVVVGHRCVGVRRIVGSDIFVHILNENVGIGQLVTDGHSAVVVLHRADGRRRGGGEHPAEQAAGGLRGAGCGRGVRQGQVALLQRQGDDAGVPVQREVRDLIVLKVMHHGGVAHGRAARAAAAGAQHRPDHQHSRQSQRQDQGVKARSFRLQKGSTPVLFLLIFRRQRA